MTTDPELVELFNSVFADYRSQRADPTEVVIFDGGLWGQLDSLGLTRLTAPESSGGSGATWREAASLIGFAAGAAAPVPLVENDLLAAWLLHEAGLPNDGQLRTACVPDESGRAVVVPYGREATSIVALWNSGGQTRVADIAVGRLVVEGERNGPGEPRDIVSFDLADLESGAPVDHSTTEQFQLRGALARCAQMCGGMERVLEVVLTHVQEREQFGRPIGKFQAVQILVSDLAAEAALARAATDAAVERATSSGWRDPGLVFAVAVAKSTSGHAASVVVRNAHQIVGAIGTTLEHELHTLTQPILTWRSEFGSVHYWDETITQLAKASGKEGLWTLITTGQP